MSERLVFLDRKSVHQAAQYIGATEIPVEGSIFVPYDSQVEGTAQAFSTQAWVSELMQGRDLTVRNHFLSSALQRWSERAAFGAIGWEVGICIGELLIHLEPKNPSVHHRLGWFYRQQNRYDEAIAAFQRAIELNSDDAWAIASRGVTYRRMKRHEEALADFNRAIELNPNDAWAIAGRGVTYGRMERYEEALADFNRAIELNPNDAWAIAGRGVTYQRMECYKEALADFNRAIELKPDDDWYLYNRALACQTLGQTDKAQADLTAAIQRAREAYDKEPQRWGNTFNLALYHLAVGEAEETERLYREALSSGASPYNIRETIRDLEDLLRVFPDHAQALAMRDLLQGHLEEIEG